MECMLCLWGTDVYLLCCILMLGGCIVKKASDSSVHNAGRLLGCEEDELREALTSRVMMGRAKGTVIK